LVKALTGDDGLLGRLFASRDRSLTAPDDGASGPVDVSGWLSPQSRAAEWRSATWVLGVGMVVLGLAVMALLTDNYRLRKSQRMVLPPPIVVAEEGKDVVVRVVPDMEKRPAIETITRRYIREYIHDRHTIILNEGYMAKVWGRDGVVYQRSSVDVHKQFEKSADEQWKAFWAAHIERKVVFTAPLESLGDSYYRQELVLIETDSNGEVSRTSGTVVLKIQFVERPVAEKYVRLNEIGLEVIYYKIQLEKA